MEAVSVVLGALAVGGCGAAIALAMGRSRLAVGAATERAAREGAERQAAAAMAKARRLGEQAGFSSRDAVSVDRAALERDLEAVREAHRTTRSTMEQRRVDDLDALEGRLLKDIEATRQLAEERALACSEKATMVAQQAELKKARCSGRWRRMR